MKILKKSMIILGTLVISASAFAHFQMVYTPNSDVTDQKKVEFKVMFTHPADGVEAHDMNIGLQENGDSKGMEKFIVVHKGESTDYVSKLKKTKFGVHDVLAYDFVLDKKAGYKGGGDWGFIAVPYPYYEGSEDIYIQQITKVFVNKNDIITDWNERIANGYPEILPKNNPMNVWVGGLFTGQVVDGEGRAVANAEIEVEYLNADIDMKKGKYTGKSKTEKAAALIYADQNGYFSFVPVEKGYWGFAALGAGGEKKYNGKELSEDAVLWIEAK